MSKPKSGEMTDSAVYYRALTKADKMTMGVRRNFSMRGQKFSGRQNFSRGAK